MNANELADELEAFHVEPEGFPYMIGEAITMLRQQQAEIEALKDEREILFGFVKSRGEIGQLIIYKASCEAQEK